MSATMVIDLARLDAMVRALDFSDTSSPGAKELLRVANKLDTKINRQAFQSSGRSIGFKWPKNNPRWGAFKKLTTGQKKPLVFRGNLKKSLTRMRDSNRIAELRDYKIELGTSVTYAGKHRFDHTAPRFIEHEGGRTFDSRGKWRIPARDFLARKPSQMEDYADELSKAALLAAVKAFARANPSPGGRGRGGRGRLFVINGADVREFLNKRTDPTFGARGGLR